ncbi:MAG: hypothetical protein U5K43_03410 [Halofilum sp. (in: g-proteobacteria)]|nr:hypothetical protein [Halofilum sp. (in: g-proteobacteria)]
MTVTEFLRFAAALRRVARARRAAAVTRALRRCGLEGMGGRRIGNLSLGLPPARRDRAGDRARARRRSCSTSRRWAWTRSRSARSGR